MPSYLSLTFDHISFKCKFTEVTVSLSAQETIINNCLDSFIGYSFIVNQLADNHLRLLTLF